MRFKQKYQMDPTVAEETLTNVFQLCNVRAHSETLKELKTKHRREARGFQFLMLIALICIVFLLSIPLYFYSNPVRLTTLESVDSTVEIVDHHLEDGIFYLTLTGEGIKFDEILIVDEDGVESHILTYDEEYGTIAFPYDSENLNIYVPQESGATLHMLLSPKNSKN
jgi:hypothetical protein